MNTASSTFTGRSKSGRGKLPYGITAATLATAKKIRESEVIQANAHGQNLFRFSEIYIQHARDLAKSGFKDEARNWYRFFSNSQILQNLSDLKTTGDVVKLRDELNFLGLECHPLEPSNFTTDIESIRNCLTEILSHVQKPSQKSKAVPRSPAGRTDNRNAGYRRHD